MNNKDFKVGDVYKQMTLGYFEFLENGGDGDKYPFKKNCECVIKYITNEGSLILEAKEDVNDGTFDASLFTGEEIKRYYPDFNGDDEREYCVLYSENSPLY